MVIVCRDEEAVRKRFGVVGEGFGIVYTRTGRRFFDEPTLGAELLIGVRAALDASGFWDEFKTDWACLDAELMPWSAKAQALVRDKYAAVGASARAALGEVVKVLNQAVSNGADVTALLERYCQRQTMADLYVQAYQQYCCPVSSVADLKVAPFHLLATEGTVHVNKDHVWHMDTLAKVCTADRLDWVIRGPFHPTIGCLRPA